MATIPLPALHVDTQQQQGPLQQYAMLQQIRNQQQEQQLRSAQIANANIETQQKQLQLQDQETLRESAKGLDWSDPNTFDKWMENAQKNGVSPQTMSQLALQRATLKEQLAKTDAQTLTTEKQRTDQLLGHIDAIRGEADPAKRAVASQMQGQQILSSGIVKDPATQQFVQAMASGQKVPTDDELASFERGLQYHSTNINQELEARKTASGEWKELSSLGLLVNTANGKILSPTGGQMTPAMLESKYVGLQQKKNEGQKLSADEQAFSQAYEKNKTLVPAFNFNLQGGGGTPTVNDPLVQSVAKGDMKIGDVLTPRTPLPLRKQFLAAVIQANPNFKSSDYDIEKGVMKEFTSGDAAKSLTAFNTAISHAQQAQAAADAMGNDNWRSLNKLSNALGVEFGSDKVTNFNAVKSALTGEVSKVFKGGQATDAEIKEVQGPLNAANSPAQLKGALDTVIHLMNSKRDALKQQYEAGTKAQPNFGAAQHVAGGPAQGLQEGATGKGSDGKPYVVRGGTWVPQ